MASLQSVLIKFLIRKSIHWNKPLAEVRAELANTGGKPAIPAGVTAESDVIQGVAVEWFRPAGANPRQALVYFHGGGYCLGIVNTNRNFVARLAKESGLNTVLVDYRLAPENPYPAALDDAAAVLRGLRLAGIQPRDTVAVADSSGSGLALAAFTQLRAAQEPLPAALACMTPMVDMTHSGESMVSRARQDPYALDPQNLIDLNYTRGLNPAQPLLSPLFADLRGLPPMLLHAADDDMFLSDATRLAERAREAGVAVELKVWKGVWHVFHLSAALLPEGRQALKEIYAFLRRALA